MKYLLLIGIVCLAIKCKKGIGLIGQVYPSMANRLIEYGIGNGPVVKKKWMIQRPE